MILDELAQLRLELGIARASAASMFAAAQEAAHSTITAIDRIQQLQRVVDAALNWRADVISGAQRLREALAEYEAAVAARS